MKRVIYAGSEFVTGDDIAGALLGCGQALAEAGEAEAVTVPIRELDGSVGEVTVLIGPASQMVARDVVPRHEFASRVDDPLHEALLPRAPAFALGVAARGRTG